MKTIAVAVIKGGTGKTTTAAAIAQAAASKGKRVLAVDLDPQGNLTDFLGADINQPGAYQLLHGHDIAETVQTTAQQIDVVAGAPNLAAEQTKAGSIMRLQSALSPIGRRYDVCVIDTPPNMGEVTFNALQAANGLLIPLETDNSSLQGLYQIVDIAGQMKKSNKRLQILGTILTRYDGRPTINRYLLDTIRDKGQEIGAPFLQTIRAGVAIREAQAMKQSLYDYAPQSKPALDYMALYQQIMEG